MLRSIFAFALVAAVFTLGSAVSDDKKEEKKDKAEPKAVGALPPHPLDDAFKNAKDERDVWNALLNNDHYLKAVKVGLKAKQDAEASRKKMPNLAGPSSAQAGREAFLEALAAGGGPKEPKGPKGDDKK